MRKLSVLGPIIASVALVVGMVLVQRGQAKGSAPQLVIPHMIGEWSSKISEVGFADPWNPNEPTNFSETSSRGEPVIFITEQQGRRFAGYVSRQPGQHDKCVGVVTEEGTITIHCISVFEQDYPDRSICRGKVFPLADPKWVTGTCADIEILVDPGYSSASYVRLRKVR